MNLFLQTQYYLSRGNKMSLALLIAAFLTGTASAETHNTGFASSVKKNLENVTGTVKDENGEPMPGVTVLIKGTKTATTTDANGVFNLNLPTGNETIVVSFIGFKTIEVAANGRTSINVTLLEDVQTLREIVVNVGYGTKAKSDILGSVASIKAEEIEDLPVQNIASALRNRIAGVGVNTTSGKPGSAVTINIRNASISEQAQFQGVTTEPLYVIDGIIVSRDDFDAIDPSMVDDISFLKDASAAIYGAAGAKGVVLVTTKKGKPGKPKISYTGYTGFSDKTRTPEMLSAYEHASLLNEGITRTSGRPELMFSDSDLERLKGVSNKTWLDQVWQVASVNRHTLNASGGTENITFFAGGNFYDESGNYGGIDFKKFGFRSGMNAKIIEGLTATVTLNTDVSNEETNTYKGGGDRDQAYYQQLVTTPLWSPMTINGLPVNLNASGNPSPNPVAVLQSGNYTRNKSQGLGINASLEYKPKFIKGLTSRVQFGRTTRSRDGREYVPPYTVYNFVRTGQNSQLFTEELISGAAAVQPGNTQLLTSQGSGQNYQLIGSLSYDKNIGKHNFSLMAATDISEGTGTDLAVKWNNQILSGVDERWAFEPTTFTLHTDNIIETAKQSYLSRLNYNYADKYFLEGIARLDASSNFAPANRWGLFPSVGLGWKISDENFFKNNINFINFMKFRANVGLVGDDRVNARLWQSRYEVNVEGYLYNESPTAGLQPSIIPNPDITWEKALNINLGVDAALFNDKLNVGIDVFRRRNYDMFDKGSNDNFPMYAGFQAPVINYQEKTSWGSEFTIGYRHRVNKDWSFNSDVNFGFSNSVIDRMFYNENQLWDNTYPDFKYQFGTDPRRYNGSNFGLVSKGMFRTQAEVDAFLSQNPNYTIDGEIPQVGWLYYEDVTGDGRITEKDHVPLFKRTSAVIGFGFNLGANYKTFSLRTNIVARFGGKEFYDSASMEAASTTRNIPRYWTDHWTPENPNARFPRYDDPSVENGWNSEFWAVDGTMIRVNNMSLSYRLPKSLLQKLGLSDLRAVFTGNNLWTLKNPLPFKDPYTNSIYDYPTLRTLSLGLNVGL